MTQFYVKYAAAVATALLCATGMQAVTVDYTPASTRYRQTAATVRHQAKPTKVPIDNNPDDKLEPIASQDFSAFTEGTEENPVKIPIAKLGDKIDPALMGGEEGWWGEGIYQAGPGVCYIPYMDDEGNLGGLRSPFFKPDRPVKVEVECRTVSMTEPQQISMTEYIDNGPGEKPSYWFLGGPDEQFEVTPEYKKYTMYFRVEEGVECAFLQFHGYDDGIYVKSIKMSYIEYTLEAPELNEAVVDDDHAVISWEAVDGATGYYLTVWTSKYNADLEDFEHTYIVEDQLIEGTQYEIPNFQPGLQYTYVLQSTDGRNVSPESYYGEITYLGKPEIIDAYEDAEGYHVAWKPVKNAEVYRVGLSELHRATTNENFSIGNVDFTGLESPGTLENPEIIDAPAVGLLDMPGWLFGCPVFIKDAIGTYYDAWAAFFGVGSLVQMPMVDLGETPSDVTVNFKAVSPNDAKVMAKVYSPYGFPMQSYDMGVISPRDAEYSHTFEGLSGQFYLALEVKPSVVPDDDDDEDWDDEGGDEGGEWPLSVKPQDDLEIGVVIPGEEEEEEDPLPPMVFYYNIALNAQLDKDATIVMAGVDQKTEDTQITIPYPTRASNTPLISLQAQLYNPMGDDYDGISGEVTQVYNVRELVAGTEVAVLGGEASISIDGDVLTVNNPACLPVSIVDMAGRVIATNSAAAVKAQLQPNAVYVVAVGGKTFKVAM